MLTPDRQGSSVAPICYGKAATIYPGNPGGGTITANGAGWSITGTAGNDVIVGSDEADIVDGGGGRDRICALDGSDVIKGRPGITMVDGGGRPDRLDYSLSSAGVTVRLTTGRGTGGDAEGDRLLSIEDLTGSEFDDVLIGNADDNVIDGLGGHDRIAGGDGYDALSGNLGNDEILGEGGDDTLTGGDGDDYLVGGLGWDVLAGGDGFDAVSYVRSTEGVTVNLAANSGSYGDAQGDSFTDIENLTGSDFADHLTGDGGNNAIDGRAGADTINGGDGADDLKGRAGADLIHGNGGADAIRGNEGDDQLFGDEGNDLVAGLDGNDGVYGGDDDDDLRPGLGVNVVDGGPGTDKVDSQSCTDTVTAVEDFTAGRCERVVSRTTSTVIASMNSVLANGTDTTTVTIQLKDSSGQNLTMGGSVVAVTTTAGTLTDTTVTGTTLTARDHGNGTYSLILKADTLYAQASMTATVNGLSLTDAEVVEFRGPYVASYAPATLVPGDTATLTGAHFDMTPANNVVQFNGRAATVTSVTSPTQLKVLVPCVGTGANVLTVRTTPTAQLSRNTYTAAVQVAHRRTLGVGQYFVSTSTASTLCNELVATGTASRYVVSVFSISTSANTSTGMQISGDNAADGPAVASGRPMANALVVPENVLNAESGDDKHTSLLERNAEAYRQMTFTPMSNRDVSASRMDVVEPALLDTFRVANINVAGICNNYYEVVATRVYYDGKVAIYEDATTPDGFKASLNPTMADYYDRIGDQFNADMEPVIRNNFGDILRRDAVTDNNGVMVALFTPLLNNNFPGVAGFVVSCDLNPNVPGNTTSNFGEFFYAYQPTVVGTGYSSGLTPDNWYRTIRSTFIHESKHLASYVARAANGYSNLEDAWLEEGSARLSEELWARQVVDPQAWKGDHGYGSAVNPVNFYCDVRPSGWAECDANTRRPVSIMQRHFSSEYTHLLSANARLLSPFGKTPSDTQSFWYAVSWSLLRYAVDRYGVSEAAFFTGLNQASTTGVTSLLAQTGATMEELLGGWALSLATDNYPGLSTPTAAIQMPTWNWRNVYAGMNTDFPSTYVLPYPQQPTSFTFGNFSPVSQATMYGGGILWYQISGTQTADQLIRLLGNGGGALGSLVRVGVVRVE